MHRILDEPPERLSTGKEKAPAPAIAPSPPHATGWGHCSVSVRRETEAGKVIGVAQGHSHRGGSARGLPTLRGDNKEQRRAAGEPGDGGHTVWQEYRTELA